jgi:hypothetical protein
LISGEGISALFEVLSSTARSCAMPADHSTSGLDWAPSLDTQRSRMTLRAEGIDAQPSRKTSWPDLCADLIREFPQIDSGDVIEEVARARSATSLFGLDAAEQYRASATIARNNLRILSGEADLARLDPETHMRRQSAPRD